MKNILVIAAHPDDEILGCGGTITKLIRDGNSVNIAILGEGITSRFSDGADSEEAQSLLEKLHADCRKAAQVLGAPEPLLYNLPDNRFDTVPFVEIKRIINELITKYEPDIVFTHSGGDLNIDHDITSRAVLSAASELADSTVDKIYAFEVPSSTEWAFGQTEPVFRPDTFIDITETIDLKLEALLCYESEVKQFPYPRSEEALRAVAIYRGAWAGVEAAEAFELAWSVDSLHRRDDTG